MMAQKAEHRKKRSLRATLFTQIYVTGERNKILWESLAVISAAGRNSMSAAFFVFVFFRSFAERKMDHDGRGEANNFWFCSKTKAPFGICALNRANAGQRVGEWVNESECENCRYVAVNWIYYFLVAVASCLFALHFGVCVLCAEVFLFFVACNWLSRQASAVSVQSFIIAFGSVPVADTVCVKKILQNVKKASTACSCMQPVSVNWTIFLSRKIEDDAAENERRKTNRRRIYCI